MADLQPIPMSQFVEYTDLNNFNDDSTFPFLDANATSAEKVNAIIKYKNFKTVLQSDLFPIEDSQIITNVDPNNLDTNLLNSIGSIQVNQYGRVVKLQPGSNDTSTPFTIANVTSSRTIGGGTVTSVKSNYVSPTTGNAWLTGIINWSVGYGSITNVTAYLTSSVKTTQITLNSTPIYLNNPVAGALPGSTAGGQTGFSLVNVVIPVVAGETNWDIYARQAGSYSNNGWPTAQSSNITFFIY